MSSSYQASKTPVKFPVSKGSPKPTKVLSSGKGNFVPTSADGPKAGQSMGGKPAKCFTAKGTR